MQRAIHLNNTCRWQPCAPPKAACVMQAVVLSAVIAVVLQSVLTIFVNTPVVFLHLIGFLCVLPVVLRFQSSLDGRWGELGQVQWVQFSPERIEAQLASTGQVVVLEVVEAGRFLGAMVVQFKPSHTVVGWGSHSLAKTFSITLWQATLGKDLFRKLSVLTLWHARRVS